MSNVLNPLPSIEKALRALLLRELPGAVVGTSLPDLVTTQYIRLARVPGGGTNRIQGDFVLDIEVFDPSYSAAESTALRIEAILLGYPWTVEVGGDTVVFDRVRQNQGVSETFWDDDNVHRLLATYVITVRR